MIIYLTGEKKSFELNTAEKDEISSVYEKGGRYISFRTKSLGYIEVYDECNGNPGTVICQMYGNIVNILHTLCGNTTKDYVKMLCIMQKYPNTHKLEISEGEINIIYSWFEDGVKYVDCVGRAVAIIVDKQDQPIGQVYSDVVYSITRIYENIYGYLPIGEKIELKQIIQFLDECKE